MNARDFYSGALIMLFVVTIIGHVPALDALILGGTVFAVASVCHFLGLND